VVLYETTAQDMLYNSDVAAKLTQLLADWPLSRIFAALALLETMQQRLVSNANGRLLAEQFLLKLRDLK
ncbi:MAG: DNA polymerase III subunit delta' C-terminal domain-containing protein, partial [Selenomonadaceae bacterium]